MMRAEARISVGMPVYNGEQYLQDSIRSVLGQTYPHFELLISDNASTDRTEEICRDFAVQDKRIAYIRNEQNLGAAGNYNRLFALASGEYFRWNNADDIAGPELHARCLACLEENPEVVLAYGKNRFLDDKGNLSEGRADNLDLRQDSPRDRFVQFYESVSLTNVIYGLMRSSAVKRTALMGDGTYPASDINFMAALTLLGKFVEIPEYLFFRRMHPGAMSWETEKNDQKLLKQFWNAGSAEFHLPTWRKHQADFKSIRTTALDHRERLFLYAFVIRRMNWEKKQLMGELVQAFSRRVRRGQPEKGR